jgi:Homing endonuclease associated repeat/HNH endonuclease
MKYQLKDFNRNVSDQDLLDDLKAVAEKLGLDKITSRQYDSSGGKYTSGTMGVRFGSWNIALGKAGLNTVMKHNPTELELFQNLEEVWIKLGRQPVFRDMKKPDSKFSALPYRTKFGTFRNALIAFVEFINSSKDIEENEAEVFDELPQETEIAFKHKTKRLPSERLKVQVLMRDGNICRLCGITLTGDNIHFDHIKPWSKGGETVLENIQILCEKHNLAKGNLDYEPEKGSH